MTVKIKLIDGTTEIFERESFTIGPEKDFFPDIMSVRVYDHGRPVASRSRKHQLIYRHFIFPTKAVQDRLAELRARQAQARAQENNP